MPETNETNTPPEGEPKGLPEVRAALDRETERRRAAEERATAGESAMRELAFLRAGVNTATPVGKLYMQGYEGELEAEAIKAGWAELGITPTPPAGGENPPPSGEQPPTEPPPTGLPESEAARLAQARAGLQSNATPPGSEPKAPVGQSMMDAAFHAQQGQRARPAGGFGPKARDAALDVVFGRAKEGDPDAVFKRPDETWGDATERWRATQ